MTNGELIEALTTLKEQARYYGGNTFVWSISIDSFKFVIDSAIKTLEQESTTKNDLAQERYQDLIEYFGSKEVAKAILGSRKEFKAWLERLRWNVKRADELARELEQIQRPTKNDLAVDYIDRQATLDAILKRLGIKNETYLLEAERAIYQQILAMPPVTPQEPRKGHWIVREDNTSFVKQIPRRWVECSYCGWSFSYDRIKDDFCSQCGADMREVEK